MRDAFGRVGPHCGNRKPVPTHANPPAKRPTEPPLAPDALAALIDKALVVSDASEPPRYRLQETTRTYAAEQLTASDEARAMSLRHAHYCARLFEAEFHAWMTTPESVWWSRVEPEVDNLR